jgi:tetratricopeptide (TPR) repeat protein
VLAETLRYDRRGGVKATEVTSLVRFQLSRATRLLALGERDAALSAVKGAIFLVKVGEARAEMWEGSAGVLVAAAEEASRIGNEGRAYALYSLVKQSKPAKSVIQSADEHLLAIKQFASPVAPNRVLEQAGDAERVAVERSLYEPSAENLEEASRQITRWMQAALDSDALQRWGEASVERQEAIEAYRAPRFGALTLIATHLRHGDSMGALEWLEQNNLGRLVPAELRNRLEQAGEDDDLTAWGQLYQFFKSEADSRRADNSIGTELAEAAAFGAAVELYRSHPESLMAIGPLAVMLPDYYLGDVTPLLIQAALGDRPGREELNWSLSLLMRALQAHGEASDLETVRRIFDAASKVLSEAKKRVKTGEALRPHPARLYRALATYEARFADLERAKSMLAISVELEPTTLGFIELGRIERQRGDATAALSALERAVSYANSNGDALGATEAYSFQFEVLSSKGDSLGAERALRTALDQALSARDKAQRAVEQAQAERRLARVLELYGKHDGAERAYQRALFASRADPQQLSVTILDSARRALVYDDLGALRQALRDAQEYGLRGEDCTYVALWLRLVERRRHLTSDGTVEDALARTGELMYWPGKLKAWLLGQCDDKELERSVRREPERIESLFYRGLKDHGTARSAEFTKLIEQVASSGAIGLVEVSMAHDLLRRDRLRTPPTWPAGIAIP